MKDLGIEEKDIEEKFIRAQGRGGQKVNKTSSCVYLIHVPTGIEVKCQTARNQAMNRYFARRLLSDKIEEFLHPGSSASAREVEKARKQKKKRARRARDKSGVSLSDVHGHRDPVE